MCDKSINPTDVYLIDDDSLLLKYKYKRHYTQPTKDENIFIAVFKTEHGKHMYEQFEQLNEQVLYKDTDSIIYVEDLSK